MDLLSDILDTLVLRGQLYFRTCFNSPWAISVPDQPGTVRFHLAMQGECYISVDSGQEILLRQGDLVLIPAGSGHILSDRDKHKPAALDNVLAETGFTGEGTFTVGKGDSNAATQLMCGHFTFAEGSNHPVLRAMPPMLHVSAAVRANAFWLDEALRLMARQVMSETPGSQSAIRRMSEVIFIETIRCCANQSPELARLMEAFTDPKISRAIVAMHKAANERWTVESLASEAAMSRSRFANRFQELVGCGPLGYLAEWRLQRARSLLSGSSISIQEIAGQVGYQSAAAFTRAFANMFGESPTEFRRSFAS